MAKRIQLWMRAAFAITAALLTSLFAASFDGTQADAQTVNQTSSQAIDQEIDPPSDQVTVVMTEFEPFVSNDDGRADGFYAEIWDTVADDLDIDYDVIWVDSFSDLLTAIDNGDAEIAIAPLTPTAEREVRFDFTSAVISSGPQLGYHERLIEQRSLLGALFSGAVRQILFAALAGLIILAHLIWFVERDKDDEDGDFHPAYVNGIWDGLWWATVTVTTVGYGDKAPRSIRGRLIALLAMLLSLFLVGAFVSQVTDVLSERRADAVVSSLDDLGDRKVGAIAGSSFAAYVEGEGASTVGYDSQTALFEAVDSGAVDIIVTNPFALTAVGVKHGVVPTGTVLYEEFETFGLAQGSAWREPINQSLADLQASGEVEEIVTRWMGQ